MTMLMTEEEIVRLLMALYRRWPHWSKRDRWARMMLVDGLVNGRRHDGLYLVGRVERRPAVSPPIDVSRLRRAHSERHGR